MITIEDIDDALKQEGDKIAIQLPEELRDFADIFSPKKAKKLPLHRSYNYKIKITSNKKLLFGRIYSISCDELIILRT